MSEESSFRWTESTVADAIERTRHNERDAWVFLRQVPNGTSNSKTNTADAIAVGCWKSKGLDLHGYEIKISRSDWLREIQSHTKAESISKHCHFWWIAAPAGVVKVEEMPANWGFVEVFYNGEKYSSRVKKAGTRNQSPELEYQFFAAALRKAKHDNQCDTEVRKKIADAQRVGREQGIKEAVKASERNARHDTAAYEALKAAVTQFEEMSGVKITGWRAPERAATAIKYYLKHGDPVEQLKKLGEMIDAIKRTTDDSLHAFTQESVH